MRRPDTALLLASLLGGSGVLHLLRPRTYEWLVPPELGAARGWVLGTGVAEVGVATLLAVPSGRRPGGWLAAVLLAGFVPAHLHTFRVVPRRPSWLGIAAARLVLQLPLIRAALRTARGG